MKIDLTGYPDYIRETFVSSSYPTMGSYPFARTVGSDGSKLKNGIPFSGEPILLDTGAIRRNARRAYHTSNGARSLCRRMADTVIDTGLKFRWEPDYKILGISKERARAWGEEQTRRFHLYMDSKDASTDNTMTGYQVQRLLFSGQYRDGEYFARFNRLRDRTDALSILSFQAIDPEMIDSDGYVNTGGYNDESIDDGIIRDKYGRETAYVVNTKVKGFYKSIRINAINSGVTQMVHGFSAEYVGQLRGISVIGHALQEFQSWTDFDIAHIQKAAQQASFFMAVESDSNEDAVDIFGDDQGPIDDDLVRPPTTEEIESADETLRYDEMDESIITQPGRIGVFNLPSKQKIKMLGNTAPIVQYGEFVNTFFSYLSAASDMPIEYVIMKFGENYSASRATLILMWRIANIYRNDFASDFLNPAKKSWIEIEIALGRVRAPGFNDPVKRAAWLAGKWIGTPMPEINPYDQARANALNATMGATDLDRIALENNGSDGQVNREKLASQVKELPVMTWKVNSNDKIEREKGNE